MNGLIVAAGFNARQQDLVDQPNLALPDRGGQEPLDNLLHPYTRSSTNETDATFCPLVDFPCLSVKPRHLSALLRYHSTEAAS